MTIDPTANVLALVAAETKRHDDLRAMAIGMTEKLAAAESNRVNEQLKLRAEYDEQLREAEAKRIDAIRAVDVAAVAVANERSIQQASVLADQVAKSAEALRSLVSTSAEAVAKNLAGLMSQLTDRMAQQSDRIASLEQSKSLLAGVSQQTTDQHAQANADRTFRLVIVLAVVGQFIGLLYVIFK